MNENLSSGAALLQQYADRLLALLERIALALEAPDTDAKIRAGLRELAHPSAPAPTADSPATQSPARAPVPIPYEAVRGAVMAYQEAKGPYAAQLALKTFGVKYIHELKAMPERYSEVLAALQ
jgi:hypothetical protein